MEGNKIFRTLTQLAQQLLGLDRYRPKTGGKPDKTRHYDNYTRRDKPVKDDNEKQ